MGMTREEFYNRYQYDNRKNKIGGGAFGTVYKAYDRRLDREVAVKVQEIKDIEGKEFSLQSEYDAIKALDDHPNIANYENVHRYEDGPGIYDFAIMQFYPLGNLSNYLKANDIDQDQKDKILVQILQGIAYLHHNKVVHRDIKPGNILVVNRPGEGIIPKITDFGLSKLAEIDDSHSLFKNSFAGGTVEYSSPEQLRGSNIKFNTDLWSFGIILFEVFTGKTLFDSVSHAEGTAGKQGEIIQQIFKKDFSKAFQNLPEQWRPVANLCLQRNPDKRPSTGKELLSKVSKSLYNIDKDIFLKSDSKKTTQKGKTDATKEEETVTAIMSTHQGADDKTIVISNQETAVIPPPGDATDQPNKEDNKPSGKKKLWLVGIVAAVLVSAIILGISQFASAPTQTYVAKVTKNGKTGYIDDNGNVIIAPRFLGGLNFSEGLAPVKMAAGWNYIDHESQTVVNGNYDLATPFSNGLALVQQENDWLFIDKNGRNAFEKTFKDASVFADGLAPVELENGWTFIDKSGKIAFDETYESAYFFSSGLAPVQRHQKWGLIDKEGKTIVDFAYSATKDFAENAIAVLGTDHRWIFIDRHDKPLFQTSFDNAKNFSEGLAAVKIDGKWGFVNNIGETSIDFKYDGAGNFVNGLAPVKIGDVWGFIDKSGNQIIEATYTSADNYYEIN